MNRPADDLDHPLPSLPDKPLPDITEAVSKDIEQLSIEDSDIIDQETRKALTDPQIFETIPAVPHLPSIPNVRPSPSPSSLESSPQTQTSSP